MGSGPTVIKADVAGRIERAALRPFHVDDMMRDVREAAAAAQAEAAQIVEQAKAQAQTIRTTAWDEGHQAGLQEGTRQGREAGRAEALQAAGREFADQQSSLVAACRQLVAEIDAGRAEWEASARRDLIDLAMAVARRVVRHVGQRERQVVLANLDQAVRLAGARSDVTILVNPADLEVAQRFARSLLQAAQQWEHVQVTAEAEVSPGGCRIRWRSGAIDAGLETQLDRIEAELTSSGDAGAGSCSEASDS